MTPLSFFIEHATTGTSQIKLRMMNFPRNEKRPESTNTGFQTECSKSCTRESETVTDILKDSLGLSSEEGSPAHAQLGSTFELPTKRDTLASSTSERGDAADHEPSTPNECSTNVVGVDKRHEVSEPAKAPVAWMSKAQEPFRAPVARMSETQVMEG